MEIDFGQKVFIRLADALREAGVGLVKPWQLRRVGEARVDIKAYEIRQIAAAEKDAEEIRNGTKTIDAQGNIVAVSQIVHQGSHENQLLIDAQARVLYRELRREINLRAIALLTQEEAGFSRELPDQRVSDQWMARWVDGAQDVSDEELRILWAKLLAGEIKRPGTFSLHTIDYLRRVSPNEAKEVEQIARLAITDDLYPNETKNCVIYRGGNALRDIPDVLLYELEEAGILNMAEFNFTLTLSSLRQNDKPMCILRFQRRVLVIRSDDPSANITIPVYKLTRLGAEIVSLGNFEMKSDYLTELISEIKARGVRIFEADLIAESVDGLEFDNEIER